MITALVILTSIVVFIVAIISPHRGTNIQMKAMRLLQSVERRTKHRHHLVRLSMHLPSMLAHRIVHYSAAAGKKSRWKLPF